MKALILLSGGLDSMLAAKLIQKQGIECLGLVFLLPFCKYNKERLGKLGIEIKYIDISLQFLELLVHPRFGFGSNINPCIDCKIFMLKKSKELMPQFKADFVVTGEVLGQRPMSQNRHSLETIEKESGLEGLLLRPLTARLLAETIPEKQGWVKRSNLLAFNGRSRKPQKNLAAEFGIKDPPNAAGGCLLTDPEFAKRLKELIAHKELSLENIELLKLGRHFRLSDCSKLVVGRDEAENKKLENLAQPGDYLFFPDEKTAGPTSLGRGEFNAGLIDLACRITCGYCDLSEDSSKIIYKKAFQEENVLQVMPLKGEQTSSLRISG